MKKGKVSLPSVLFTGLPDDIVLILLSYCDLESIQSTRVWQSAKVRYYTQTITMNEAIAKENLDNMKWIKYHMGDNSGSKCIGMLGE